MNWYEQFREAVSMVIKTHFEILNFQESDPVVEKLYETSEEGQKVTRNKGDKFVAVFRRVKLLNQ